MTQHDTAGAGASASDSARDPISHAEEVFADYLWAVEDHPHREEFLTVLAYLLTHHPDLTPVVKWNQPMFTDHGTFIIGFSVAKQHFSVAPEVLEDVLDLVRDAGYTHGAKLFRIPFTGLTSLPDAGSAPSPEAAAASAADPRWRVIDQVIAHNRKVKAEVTTFWRPKQR